MNIEELKPNMYIKTLYGEIGKLFKDKDGDLCIDFNGHIYDDQNCLLDMIAEAKDNLIDLIKAGDYVNGEKIYQITSNDKFCDGKGKSLFNEECHCIYSNFQVSKYKDISSIVTHEQFASMEYKVAE